MKEKKSKNQMTLAEEFEEQLQDIKMKEMLKNISNVLTKEKLASKAEHEESDAELNDVQNVKQLI